MLPLGVPRLEGALTLIQGVGLAGRLKGVDFRATLAPRLPCVWAGRSRRAAYRKKGVGFARARYESWLRAGGAERFTLSVSSRCG